MIINLKYGNTNTFLIKGDNKWLLIDTDFAGTINGFYKAIKEQNIILTDIEYVLATHYHPDHSGLISLLLKKGIRLLLLESQVPYLNYSLPIFKRIDHLDYEPIDISCASIIKFKESRMFLKELGIYGEIISTPSHSEDSISLILDTGECFVGDLEPYAYLNAYKNNIKLKKDWDSLLKRHVKIINFSHINQIKL